jgi:hypothetical protein
MAAPTAAAFVLWIAGLIGSLAAFRKSARLVQSRRRLACACLLIALVTAAALFLTMPSEPALADNPEPNAPIGVPRGINPGRVVWAHDPDATSWAGPGQGHWWEPGQTDQRSVDAMMSRSLLALTGARNDKDAWNALFRHFNKAHGGKDAGYRAGEKIAIKINLVGCIVGRNSAVDLNTYELVRERDYMNTGPQMIASLLRQLVKSAGVRQEDISIGDPLSRFPKEYYELLRGEFPNVRYMDFDGGTAEQPRRKIQPSSVPFYFSCRPQGTIQDYVPDAYAEAKYFISMANLKSHTMAGITVTGKNHYGSLARTPPQKGYYNLHESLPRNTPATGRYRALVDLMGHAHTGGKGLVFFIDGLYAGVHPVEHSPKKWNTPPFNGDWTSSLFVSQDQVALDSVAFDLLFNEWSDHPHMSGADDYLHEAALADNPPSGTFYDPDHATATVRLPSLGVHEHWNNPQSRQYSRNLGTGKGIELVRIPPPGL